MSFDLQINVVMGETVTVPVFSSRATAISLLTSVTPFLVVGNSIVSSLRMHSANWKKHKLQQITILISL